MSTKLVGFGLQTTDEAAWLKTETLGCSYHTPIWQPFLFQFNLGIFETSVSSGGPNQQKNAHRCAWYPHLTNRHDKHDCRVFWRRAEWRRLGTLASGPIDFITSICCYRGTDTTPTKQRRELTNANNTRTYVGRILKGLHVFQIRLYSALHLVVRFLHTTAHSR